MTSPTGPGPLSVGSPAAVLAIVPHLLGFLPRKSLVIIGAGQPRGRIHVTFRFDLPDPPDPESANGAPPGTYGPFLVADGRLAVLITSAGSTVKVGVTWAVAPLASVTLIVTV